jgi:hypothetical protein
MANKRDRRRDQEDCPKCRAKKGEKCRNYQGKGKQPCRLLATKPIPVGEAIQNLIDTPTLFETKGE